MKDEAEQICESKDGGEETRLDCTTDKSVDDGVCPSEAGT